MGCASSAPKEEGQSAPAASPQNESQEQKMAKRRLSVAPQHAALSSTASVPLTDSKDNANLSALELQGKGSVRHAVTSRKGLVPYNKNKVNQDRFVFKYALGDDPSVSMWGVMDGHGEYGHYVAAFVQENLPQCLAAEKGMRQSPEAAITRATAAMCKRLQETDINCAFSGSTLVFGVRIDDVLYVANVGDSRCVLCKQGPNGQIQAVPLSTDQKPERPDEKARILAHGGRVEPLPGPPGECGPARVWLAEADVPGLAMSRSVGDEVSQTVGVTSVPEIVRHEIVGDDLFAVWASDGVWEFLSDDQALQIIRKHWPNIDAGAAALAEESTKRWRAEEEVIDDITVLIVAFNQQQQQPQQK